MTYLFLNYFSYTVYFGVVIYLNIPLIYKYVYPVMRSKIVFYNEAG